MEFSRLSPLLWAVVLLSTAALAQDVDALLKSMQDFNAVQVVYRQGVPHTDPQGNLLTQYDPERSFFQLGIWGNPYGTVYGHEYDLQVLTDAGFNTIWPWPMGSLEKELAVAREAGLRVVHMRPVEEAEAAKYKDDPNWLGLCWKDEPTGSFWGKDMQGKYDEFLAYRDQFHAAAPGRLVFINDVPWVTAPATTWWAKWNTAGDVACHDNYPVLNRKHRSRSLGDEGVKSGIPTTTLLAAAVNREEKPVWLIVGAFTQRGHGAFPFRFATPMQLRAQVYAGLVHGATGIIYFCWDTFVCRDGNVMGMSPDPQVAYSPGTPNTCKPSPAKPMELAESRALWTAATQINHEIQELTPSLLSPTVGPEVVYKLQTEGEPVSQSPVRCLLKPHPDGGYLLLTVNVDDAVMKVTYEFPAGLATVQPMFENREAVELADDGQSFTDMYDPFETHVYRITAP